MSRFSAITRAVGTLTITAITGADTQTCVIGGKTYTFQTTLTNVDGNVLIGADITAMAANLAAAINLGAGAGTTYAAAMTVNPYVYATSAAGVVTVYSKVPGREGNFVPTTETLTNASWGGATLASGTGDIYVAVREMRAMQPNSQILAVLDAIDASSLEEV